jgi:metal-dependent amidase/aminoacylase/carboxypeptidase family protein
MEGTLRTFDREHAKYLPVRLAECAKYTALASGCVAVTEILSSSPALINSSALLTRATELFRRELPYVLSSNEVKMQKSIGGSEDFAYFSQNIPSLFFSLSAGDTNFSPYPLHHPAVRFDEGCLPYGCAALCALAFDENGGKD